MKILLITENVFILSILAKLTNVERSLHKQFIFTELYKKKHV